MNLERFLAPFPGDNPAGTDIDASGFLLGLDHLIGWSDASPRGPEEWRKIRDKIEEGFGESRDLRLAVALSVSMLNLEGIAGFVRGIRFVRDFLESSWDYAYPHVEEDGNADTRRNTLLNFLAFHRVIRPLHTAVLVEQAGIGRFSIFDVDLAEGRIEPPADNKREIPSIGAIHAALEALGAAGLQSLVAVFDDALSDLAVIGTMFDERAPESGAPALDRLIDLLRRARGIVKDRLPQEEPVSVEEGGDSIEAGATVGAATAAPGEIRTRRDAVRVLERVARFFLDTEPSSPIPLLLERAVRLADSDFLTIVEDLAPDALVQARLLRGRTAQNS